MAFIIVNEELLQTWY